MAVRYNIDRWPTCGSLSTLMASVYGAHIYNVQLNEDSWNGSIVGIGDYVEFDYWEEVEPTTFEAKVLKQMANGNYMVQVTAAENAWLVADPAVVETEWTNDFKQEKNFFMPAGSVARAHELKVYDRFELSPDAFDGDPYEGAVISGVSDKKPVVEASA